MSKRSVIGTALALAAALAAADLANAAGHRTLKVTNATRKTLINIYLTPLACNDDYDDALGEGLIRPGKSQSVVVESDCGCRFNLRFVFEDKTTIDRYDVDICKKPAYRVTGR